MTSTPEGRQNNDQGLLGSTVREDAGEPTPRRGRLVVFLDVDGVLNSRQGWEACLQLDVEIANTRVDPAAVARLKRIVDSTGAQIVLSSTWRLSPEHRIPLALHLRKQGIRILDRTPAVFSGHRGTEIDRWLDDHPEVIRFVILDDDADMHPHDAWLVKTTFDRGLLDEHVDAAVAMLSGVKQNDASSTGCTTKQSPKI